MKVVIALSRRSCQGSKGSSWGLGKNAENLKLYGQSILGVEELTFEAVKLEPAKSCASVNQHGTTLAVMSTAQ